jgi:hypothetical protein
LEQISQKLRENLVSSVKDCPLEIGTTWLEKFLNMLKQTEELLLPKKKQRALVEMKWVLKKYKDEASNRGDIEREWLVQEWLALVEEESHKQRIDLSILAEQWLDLIRPWWFERLKKRRPSTPLRLKHLSKDLIEKPIETEKLREALKVPEVKPLDERIVAAIIGVP